MLYQGRLFETLGWVLHVELERRHDALQSTHLISQAGTWEKGGEIQFPRAKGKFFWMEINRTETAV